MGWKFTVMSSGAFALALLTHHHQLLACELKRAPKPDAEARKPAKSADTERWRIVTPRALVPSAAPTRRIILQ